MTKRFDIDLFIIHPTLDPASIGKTLGLDAKVVHRVGDQRRAPSGRLLEGTYRDTRWRHRRHFKTSGQHFGDKIVDLLADIEPSKAFLHELRSTGGSACVVVHLLGDGYLGDKVSYDTLKKLIDLKLDFGIECYAEPQSGQ
ncbi:MAG: DUF4279 domain-containing protein [Rhodospirillales bacterium]|nr:DUF4279 domain-containing protein [Rhodospirillales bacterium]